MSISWEISFVTISFIAEILSTASTAGIVSFSIIASCSITASFADITSFAEAASEANSRSNDLERIS